MKKSLITLVLTACASTVYAAPTAVLQVNGKLTNSPCTHEVSNGGIIDYGYIHQGVLLSSETNQLGQKNIDFTINCISLTRVGWTQVVGYYLQGDSYRTWSTANATGAYDPIAISSVTFPIVTSLAIRDSTTLAITDDTNQDGQLTVSSAYL